MDAKESIIELGKMLAAEERADCADTAAPGGLSAYLREWQTLAPAALHEPAVQATLDALDGYSDLAHSERAARLMVALDRLRNMFRAQ
ncbi:MAG TPA: DNA helicase RecG, partial [Herpetosiphonaceae bacterium]|nr:DNA helicase RecG [Herpetosiphonaceae bacterium]